MGFSRQEYWSGLPCPPPGIFLMQGSNRRLLHCLHWQACTLPLALPGKPNIYTVFPCENNEQIIYLFAEGYLGFTVLKHVALNTIVQITSILRFFPHICQRDQIYYLNVDGNS